MKNQETKLTAAEIKEAFTRELAEFLNTLPNMQKQISLESYLVKLQSLIDNQIEQVKDLENKNANIQSQINSAPVEEFQSLSKQQGKILASIEDAELVLNNLQTRKNDISAQLKEIKEAIQPEIVQFMRDRHEKIQKETTALVDVAEANVTAFQGFVYETLKGNDFDTSKILGPEFNLQIYAPELEEILRFTMRPVK
jgi:chromosome segregation ATPase